MTVKEIAELTGGRIDGGDAEAVVRGLAIDSRAVAPGDLFVALAGERTDGHRYLREAIDRGAAALLVAEGREVPSGAGTVRVTEPGMGLRRLAAGIRARLRARVVAITGSSGKTITKELTAAVARTQFSTVASEASFNNEIGVPLTIFAADPSTEILVAEVGSRGLGHIAALMPVLKPDVGVVINVGPAHVGMFGSVENVAKAKGELVEGLGPDGVAVLNADDPAVAAMASRGPARTVTFGADPRADVRAEEVHSSPEGTASFTLVVDAERHAVNLRMPGEHLVSDALAAAAVGLVLGVPAVEIATSISTVLAPAWRMEIRDAPGGWRVVNDAYNANPASTAAALKTLVALRRGGRTWAVLGTMAELGAFSIEEHDRIGRLAVRLGVDRLVVIGEDARPLYEAARREGMTPEEATLCDTADGAVAYLRGALASGDVVLVKASRAAGLERVAIAVSEQAT